MKDCLSLLVTWHNPQYAYGMVTEILIFVGVAAFVFLPILLFRGLFGVLSTRIVFWLLMAGANFVGWLIIIGIFAGLSALFGGTLPWWVILPVLLIGPAVTALLGLRFRSEVEMAWPHIASWLLWGVLWIGAATLVAGVLSYQGHEEPYSLIAISLVLSTAGLILFRYAYRRLDVVKDAQPSHDEPSLAASHSLFRSDQISDPWKAQVEPTRALIRDEGMERAIASMREAGLSIIGSIRVLAELGYPLKEAKRLVHFSQAWAFARETNERFHAEIEKAAMEWADKSDRSIK